MAAEFCGIPFLWKILCSVEVYGGTRILWDSFFLDISVFNRVLWWYPNSVGFFFLGNSCFQSRFMVVPEFCGIHFSFLAKMRRPIAVNGGT